MTILIEDLVSRGHRFQDLVDGYPVALLLNFSRAARANRRKSALDLAVGVSLGIHDALGKGDLAKAWLDSKDEDRVGRSPLVTPRAAQFLASMPVLKGKKDE